MPDDFSSYDYSGDNASYDGGSDSPDVATSPASTATPAAASNGGSSGGSNWFSTDNLSTLTGLLQSGASIYASTKTPAKTPAKTPVKTGTATSANGTTAGTIGGFSTKTLLLIGAGVLTLGLVVMLFLRKK